MSTTPLYAYSPRPREGVAVEVTEGAEEACSIRVVGEVTSTLTGPATTMSVPDAKVREVARELLAALHEAAGLPVPIVLDRVPESTFHGWFLVEHHGGIGRVLLNPAGPLDLEAARLFAAALVAAVERAEREPDPAEVEALAEAIRGDERAFGGRPDKWAERAARAVLARYTLTERKPGAAS